ncbi:MAG: transglycosylase domain-containing protein [Desulfitobacteriaceae bacterium]
MSPSKGHKPRKRVSKWRVFLLTLLTILLFSGIGLLTFVFIAASNTPSWTPDALSQMKQASTVYAKDGQPIAQLHAEENRLTASADEIPDLVKKTFVAVEDKRFYQHFGVDPIRIIGSAFRDILSRSKKEGASTITIQLARNAFIQNPTAKTLTRKIQEATLAIQLERRYTKDEILTFYLNKIFFGESSFGIKAAAQTYFGKSLKDLNPGEVALLAGLPQAPTQYDPYLHPDTAKYRRTIVLGLMKDSGIISESEYTKYKDAPFTYVDNIKKTRGGALKTTVAQADYKFPYFVDYVIEELESDYNLSEDQIFNGGLQIYSTVDPKIQATAEAAFADPANFPQGMPDMQVEGAMTLMDPSTGSIRAMVGGRNYTPRGINRAWYSKRQPGSAIKPLVVYGPAIEKGGFFPGSVQDDMPVKYNAGDGKVWAPVDFDTETAGWKGLITMRFALEDSVNVYAVKLLNQIGVRYGWQYAKDRLGLPLDEKDKDNLSLALGTAQVSTLDMTAAYSVYANNGIRVTKHAVDKVLDSQGNQVVTPKITKERVIKETTAYMINNLLRSVVTNGTGMSAQIGNWAIDGKTGTTSLPDTKYPNRSGNNDAWFAGYTKNYAAVVWMGYDSDPDGKHYLHKVYGGSFPAKIWKKVMTAALQPLPVETSWPQPSGIVSGEIDTKSGLLPSSLTPPQFTATEIAVQGDFPTKVSDVWVQKDVDADHPDLLALPTTPKKLTKVFLNVPNRDPSIPWPDDEAPYKPPTEYAPEPPATPIISPLPPVSDNKLPTPNLGPAPILYDATSMTATLPLTLPQNSDKYTLLVYIKRPGQLTIDTYFPKDITPKTTSVVVPLGGFGKVPVPGDYLFWTAFQDPTTKKIGPPSISMKLTLTD